MVKRIFDLIISIILLILLFPLLLIVAVLIKIDSKGPVFFLQKRVGKDGKIFTIYKFRTLYDGNPSLHINSKEIKNINDFVFPLPPEEQLTRVGKVLRSLSINELPQLINVLKGEMSLVGPRPEVPEIVELCNEHYKKRLKIKPGITGLAQITHRYDSSIKETLKYDLEYIENCSLFLDFKILLKTLLIVLHL